MEEIQPISMKKGKLLYKGYDKKVLFLASLDYQDYERSRSIIFQKSF